MFKIFARFRARTLDSSHRRACSTYTARVKTHGGAILKTTFWSENITFAHHNPVWCSLIFLCAWDAVSSEDFCGLPEALTSCGRDFFDETRALCSWEGACQGDMGEVAFYQEAHYYSSTCCKHDNGRDKYIYPERNHHTLVTWYTKRRDEIGTLHIIISKWHHSFLVNGERATRKI